ncbi:gliding motility-associated C-terminal domain-containing protein [Flavobacterium sp. CBA20B-1]|uniref:gliding motility-associated C-terminal domain-containing protein n=1 Tax=unclassified Flavobacterium TaxID=196869 RepID=UPI0022253CF4|nr:MULTISPECIES: gliding motility-associated C-terminal domain-containing protein [unclassified Flavobacterium]WCM42033.1 gliding motility-associated C-terminal domain-containing protein [Flavobacterium sp. CBA20B-1]
MLKTFFLFAITLLTSSIFAQKVSFYKQFYGSYDYTMLGNTMNVQANGQGLCDILTASSATLNIPGTKEIEAAYLYWSGNGNQKEADLNVKLNGVDVESERLYLLVADAAAEFGYFSAFADVTNIVKQFGETEYTLSELDLTKNIQKYCGSNYVGWAIVVVYKDENIENNLVAIYDGFENLDIGNPLVNIVLDGFRITNAANSKISFLAWEGDETLAYGEQLLINDIVVSNALNPANNAFNCTNSYSNSTQMWNMDLDQYDLSTYVEVDDTVLDIKVTTAADVVFLNTIVLSVYSVFPDATIKAVDYQNYCHTRTVDIDYIVGNYNGNHPLKAQTPVAFYINDEFVGKATTNDEIAIGAEAKYTTTLNIPAKFGYRFDITMNIDDDGTKKGVVYEIDEENNSTQMHVNLVKDCPIQKGVSANFDGKNDGFDLSIYDPDELKIFNRYGKEVYKHGKGYTNQWVGKDANGRELPSGTYFYVFKTPYETISGYIYLLKELR